MGTRAAAASCSTLDEEKNESSPRRRLNCGKRKVVKDVECKEWDLAQPAANRTWTLSTFRAGWGCMWGHCVWKQNGLEVKTGFSQTPFIAIQPNSQASSVDGVAGKWNVMKDAGKSRGRD